MIRARLWFPLPILLLATQFGYSSVKVIPAQLTPQATAAFDHYVANAEAKMNGDPAQDSRVRGGDFRIEPGGSGLSTNVPGGMIQDWVGTMFIPGATLAQVRSVLQDYADYQNYYRPKVIASKQLAHSGEDFDIFLRLREQHLLTVVLNTTYQVEYRTPNPRELIVIARSTRIAEVKDPDRSLDDELPVGDDSGFLWRLNSYWRLEAADGGVYARCEAISLSRDVPLGLGWMLKGFLASFPKESMLNTLQGTRAAVEHLKGASVQY